MNERTNEQTNGIEKTEHNPQTMRLLPSRMSYNRKSRIAIEQVLHHNNSSPAAQQQHQKQQEKQNKRRTVAYEVRFVANAIRHECSLLFYFNCKYLNN